MAGNDLKKMMIFSSTSNKKLVEKIMADRAEVEHTSTSLQIEKTLLGVLPSNEEAAAWIKEMYINDIPIGQILSNIYAFMGAGINWHPRYNNAFDLVQFSYELSSFAGDINRADNTWFHFISQFRSVVNILTSNAEKSNTYEATEAANYAKDLLNIAEEDRGGMRYVSIWGLVISSWSILFDSQCAYRMMSDLSIMQYDIEDTARTRTKLMSILSEVSASWE